MRSNHELEMHFCRHLKLGEDQHARRTDMGKFPGDILDLNVQGWKGNRL